MTENSKRMWLIDAGYLFNAQRSVSQDYRLDYRMLRKRLEADGEIWRAYYLNSTPNPPSDQQDSFHSWLRSAPPRGPKIITKLYQLKTTTVRRSYCTTCGRKVELTCPNGRMHELNRQTQKGVDVGLATLALVHRANYETLILSSGDGDLLDAVDVLSENGKRIELAVFKAGVSTDLQARADRIYWIDDFSSEVERGDGHAAESSSAVGAIDDDNQ